MTPWTTFLLGAALAASVALPPSTRAGDIAPAAQLETRPVKDFSEIHISGAFTVEWRPGEPSLEIEAADEVRAHIVTTIEQGRLEIRLAKDVIYHGKVRVRITGTSLRQIMLEGAVSLTSTGLDEDSLTVGINGASRFKATGAARKVSMEVMGASRVEARDLVVTNLRIDLSGASKAQVHATDTLRARVEGASRLDYVSTQARTDINTYGASTSHRIP